MIDHLCVLCRSFDTKAGEWQDVHLRFNEFLPLFRAKKVKDASLNPSTVTSVQVLASCKTVDTYSAYLATVNTSADVLLHIPS